MKILEVRAKNFRSYSGLHWKLRDNGLVLIDGLNTENGRSNMSGKTTLLDSAFWGLFGYLPKWNGPKGGPVDAVIKRGEASCQVSVTFENEGHVFVIERSRPARLKLTRDGLPVDGKSADLDQRAQAYLGLSPAQFLLSVYISQDRTSSFFTMGDSERANLLSVIAGLENLNITLERVKEEKKGVGDKLQRVMGAISILSASFGALPVEKQQAEQKLSELEKSIDDLRLSLAAAAALAEASKTLERENLVGRLVNEEMSFFVKLGELNEDFARTTKSRSALNLAMLEEPKVEAEIEFALTSLTQQVIDGEAFNAEVDRTEAKNLRIKDGIGKALADAEKVRGGSCGTCGQNLPHWDHQEAMRPFVEHATKLSLQLQDVPAKVDLAPLRLSKEDAQRRFYARKAELDAIPNQVKAQIKALDEKASLLQRESVSMERSFLLLKESLLREMRAVDESKSSEVAAIEHTLSSMAHSLEHTKGDLIRIERQEKDLKEKLAANEAEAAAINRKLDELLDLIDLFGPKGLRTIYFDDIIQRIGARAGQLFSVMTDGAYSTRIDQEGETAKGETRLILRPVITKGGLQVPQDDLSGGARRMAMLAYDIAVSESVADTNTLFLDEALDGLDAQGKAEAMKLLEEVSKTRSVYIVDHTSEIRAAVQDVIQIQYTKGSSSLES
jgi:DNA repair exonuclease SbcCD ATPase subunit